MATVQTLQAQQHIFRYQRFYINKSQPLGHGSYGAVYKAKCDQLPCAAKVIHPQIIDPTDPGTGKIMERFQQECAFMASIRHPNIVQYLGMTRDPESRLPVLLMELLDESLTKMLEHSQQSLAYYVQVDICHDIALAVTYLHSKDIIHRDLSSNNVLMIAGRRAKVTDFGMSKLAGAAPSSTPLTTCPGTLAYMPPEALREPPRYTKKLDCFSEGVIMIQVCTRLWPDPGPRTQIIEDSRSPMGVIEMPVCEIERRKDHIDLIDPKHALLPVAKDCLQFEERNRPSSEELCQRLADLKESGEYRDYRQDEIQPNNNRVLVLTQQLQEKRVMLPDKDDEILRLGQTIDRVLQQRENEVHEGHRMLYQEKNEIHESDTLLEEQEQVTAEIQQIDQRQIEQLQLQLSASQQSLKPPQPPPPSRAQVRGRERKRLRLKSSLQVDHKPLLNWKDGGKAPIVTERGAAVTDRKRAFFMNWNGEVCFYNFIDNKWRKLQKCPYEGSSLAIIDSEVTAIGGCKKDTLSNKLLGLPGYKEIFPPMPTKRRNTVAVTSKEHLIVAGGTAGFSYDALIMVEVMHTKTLFWSTVASLPHHYAGASGTIHGDQLYMLGGFDDKDRTKSVLTCSLTELLLSSSTSSSSSIWQRIGDAPAYSSTCVAVNGELLAVGGCDENDEPTASIHEYDPTTDSWDLISSMPTARYFSLIAVLPTNEMMVVGGKINQFSLCIGKVEFADFVWS